MSKYTVYRMVHNGTIPAVKTFGRSRLMVDPDVLDSIVVDKPARPTAAEMPVITSPEALLTCTEVAGMLRCGVETVRRLVVAGELRAIRNPGRATHLRIPYASVRTYLARNSTNSVYDYGTQVPA